jgi:8-oxo-dGTP diphosphatase
MDYSLKESIFNVRIYGILIENGRILIADELHNGRLITKFPGGGLQFGEGTIECVKREFMEELGIRINVISHFYTTDFFQPSAFNATQQVISIYYLVESTETNLITVNSTEISPENSNGIWQKCRWIESTAIDENYFTFPIDKKVGGMLQNYFQGV